MFLLHSFTHHRHPACISQVGWDMWRRKFRWMLCTWTTIRWPITKIWRNCNEAGAGYSTNRTDHIRCYVWNQGHGSMRCCHFDSLWGNWICWCDKSEVRICLFYVWQLAWQFGSVQDAVYGCVVRCNPRCHVLLFTSCAMWIHVRDLWSVFWA